MSCFCEVTSLRRNGVVLHRASYEACAQADGEAAICTTTEARSRGSVSKWFIIRSAVSK